MQQPQQQNSPALKWFAILTAGLAVVSLFMWLTNALQPPAPGV